MDEFATSTLETNGITVQVYRSGGAKPPLVLAHGITDSGLCWTPVARRLAAHFDVVMYDARGHGRSEAPATGYATADYAADLVGLVAALGLERPLALGHSLGADTVALAATTPGLFRRVVLEDPPWRAVEDEPNDGRSEWIERWRANVIENKTKSIDELLEIGRQQSPRWSEDERGPWALAKQQVNPVVFDGAGTIGRGWRTTVVQIDCPALLVIGDTDRGGIVSLEVAQEASTINAQLAFVHISGTGHNIRREGFDAYMHAVEAFLLLG